MVRAETAKHRLKKAVALYIEKNRWWEEIKGSLVREKSKKDIENDKMYRKVRQENTGREAQRET